MSEFSQADLDAAKKEAAKEAKEEARKEFAAEQAKQAKKVSDKAVAKWVKDKVKDGVIMPALVDGGLVQFMQSLDISEKHEFSEGDESTPLEFCQDMLEFLGGKNKIQTKEFARKEDAPAGTGRIDPQVEAQAARTFQAAEAKKGRNIGIAQALTEVRAANAQGGE